MCAVEVCCTAEFFEAFTATKLPTGVNSERRVCQNENQPFSSSMCELLLTQDNDGVNLHGPTRRHQTCRQRNQSQNSDNAQEH